MVKMAVRKQEEVAGARRRSRISNLPANRPPPMPAGAPALASEAPPTHTRKGAAGARASRAATATKTATAGETAAAALAPGPEARSAAARNSRRMPEEVAAEDAATAEEATEIAPDHAPAAEAEVDETTKLEIKTCTERNIHV